MKNFLFLTLALLIFVQCDNKDDDGTGTGGDRTFRLLQSGNSSSITNASVTFYRASDCAEVVSGMSNGSGEVTLTLPVDDYIILADDGTFFYRVQLSESVLQRSGKIDLGMESFGGVGFDFVSPGTINSYAPGDLINVVFNIFNQGEIASKFEYRLSSDNGEVMLQGMVARDGRIDETFSLAEKRAYTFNIGVYLFNRLVDQFSFDVFNTLIPPINSSFRVEECQGVLIEWDRYDDADFSYYEIKANYDIDDCPFLTSRHVIDDQDVTSFLDTEFPLKPELCYSVVVQSETTSSSSGDEKTPIANPLDYTSLFEAITPYFIGDRIFYPVQNSVLGGSEALRKVKGYDFGTQMSFESRYESDPVYQIAGKGVIAGEPVLYLIVNQELAILSSELGTLTRINMSDDNTRVTVLDNGYAVHQKYNSDQFEIYQISTGALVSTTPSIVSVNRILFPISNGRFVFVNDPFTSGNTIVTLVSIDGNGEYSTHETFDLGTDLTRYGAIRQVDFETGLLFASNGSVYDLNDNGNKVAQLFDESTFVQNFSVDGAYVSYFNPGDATAKVYNWQTNSLFKELDVFPRTTEVYLSNGFLHMVIIRDLSTGVKRVPIN